MRTTALPRLTLATLLALGAPAVVAAQRATEGPEDLKAWEADCRRDGGDERARWCEARSFDLPKGTRRFGIDGRQNGGVAVHGWSRDAVLLVAKIQSWGEDEREAQELARGVTIDTRPEAIRASSPSGGRRSGTAVSWELWVPRGSDYDLELEAHNGGVSISDIGGHVRAETQNGGLRLANLSGDVRAHTTNGGLTVTLAGDRWSGTGLDAETTNGGVRLDIPDGYSARLETGTVNGGMNVDFPITLQGRIGRRLETTLGSGGAPIRVITTNGGVTIRRR